MLLLSAFKWRYNSDITRSDIILFCIQHCRGVCTQNAPYLALTCELWDFRCEDLGALTVLKPHRTVLDFSIVLWDPVITWLTFSLKIITAYILQLILKCQLVHSKSDFFSCAGPYLIILDSAVLDTHYLSIHKIQWCIYWSKGSDTYFDSTLNSIHYYFSMLWSTLIVNPC